MLEEARRKLRDARDQADQAVQETSPADGLAVIDRHSYQIRLKDTA